MSEPIRGRTPRRRSVREVLDLLDAVRALRPRQVLSRPRRLVPPRLLAARLDERDPPGWAPLAGGLGVQSAPQSGPQDPPHQSGRLAAVGLSRAPSDRDLWIVPDADDGLLFAFTLHGFDGLADYAAGARTPEGDRFWAAVLERWLTEAGEPAAPGWHPYPTSRLIAWCAALSAEAWPAELVARIAARACIASCATYVAASRTTSAATTSSATLRHRARRGPARATS